MAEVEFPENDFTRMIEQVAAGNRSGVHTGGVPTSGEPRPSVRSAALGRVVPPTAPEPLMTLGEKEELDQLARAAGIKDERLGNTDGENPPELYATLDEALAAGAPVHPRVIDVPVEKTTGENRGRRTVLSAPPPRLPNFRNVQGIDLIRGLVYVDDLEFPLPVETVANLRQLAVETARDEIMKSLEEAATLFTRLASEATEAISGRDTDEETETKSLQPDSSGGSKESSI